MLTYEQKIDAIIEYLRMHDRGLDSYIVALENQTVDKTPKSIDFIIRDVLLDAGIKPSVMGFRTLMVALKLIMSDSSYLRGVYKRLYPDVAEIMGISNKSAESSIRHACEGIGTNKEVLSNLAIRVEDAMKKGGVVYET